MNNREGAITVYQKLLKFNPASVEAHRNLSNIYLMEQRYPEALAEQRDVVRLKPQDASEHNNLGNLFYRIHDLDNAINEYQEALRLDPNNVGTQRNLNAMLQMKASGIR